MAVRRMERVGILVDDVSRLGFGSGALAMRYEP
jgi:hypothetical protein